MEVSTKKFVRLLMAAREVDGAALAVPGSELAQVPDALRRLEDARKKLAAAVSDFEQDGT